MVNEAVVKVVKKYLEALIQHDLPVDYGIIFGSQVHGQTDKWSDIDLLVVSPQFDDEPRREDVNLLWRIAARTDNRIEPIAVGQRQFAENDSSTILEIARREGQIVSLAE